MTAADDGSGIRSVLIFRRAILNTRRAFEVFANREKTRRARYKEELARAPTC